VLAGDAREFHTRQPLAAVLCSPPYPGVYDYLPMQTLRHVWFGVDPEKALNREMGSRRAFRKDGEAARAHWRVDTARWLARCFGALQSIGGLLVLLGDGRAGDRVLGVSEPLRLLAGEVGFRLVAGASVLRPEPGWGPGRLEHAFLFEKPLP
jgi:DNA modification methylase